MKANELLKDVKKTYERKGIQIESESGKAYTIQMETKFKETKIIEIVDGLVERSVMCTKEGMKFDTTMCLYALMLKQFTDIEFSKFNQLKRQYAHEVEMLKAVIDMGLFTQIMNVFEPEEMKKIEGVFEQYKASFKAIHNEVIAQKVMRGEEDGDL
ncbi:MAG: hypothetical protein RSA51_07250 [Niameybacter sp.]